MLTTRDCVLFASRSELLTSIKTESPGAGRAGGPHTGPAAPAASSLCRPSLQVVTGFGTDDRSVGQTLLGGISPTARGRGAGSAPILQEDAGPVLTPIPTSPAQSRAHLGQREDRPGEGLSGARAGGGPVALGRGRTRPVNATPPGAQDPQALGRDVPGRTRDHQPLGPGCRECFFSGDSTDQAPQQPVASETGPAWSPGRLGLPWTAGQLGQRSRVTHPFMEHCLLAGTDLSETGTKRLNSL